MRDTTVVIPNYNGIKYIENCLCSIRDAGNYPVIVVDNGSCDGSVKLIEELADSWKKDDTLNITLIKLDENTGFCHAANLGLSMVTTQYAFLLNNDTRITKSTISCLENRMATDRKIFSVQSKILSMANPEIIDDAGDLYCSLGWAFARGNGKASNEYPVSEEVFACCGAAVLYRLSYFEDCGYFDENHFAYLEDIDLGYRARIHGLKNVYEPSSIIYHAGSATSGSRHNKFKVDLSSQNSVYLIYKNMPLLQIIINFPFLIMGFAIKILYFSCKGLGITYLKGLMKGINKCAEDMRDNHRHKVWFRTKYIPSYIKIQIDLWANMFVRIVK